MWLAEIGLSEHLSSGWRGQHLRVIRWHERVARLGSCDDEASTPTTAFDELYAFFQNCFHLRDWLKNDGALSEQRLQAFMAGNMEMAVCRDIANGTKHLRVDRPTLDSKPTIGREYHPAEWPGKRLGTNKSYFIILEDRRTQTELRFDLQDLAARCVGSWQGLLRAEGLLN